MYAVCLVAGALIGGFVVSQIIAIEIAAAALEDA